VVRDRLHTLAVRGLRHGLAVMADRETGSYWDHITGECLLGPLKGQRLESFPLRYTTVGEELARNPDALVVHAPRGRLRRLLMTMMQWLGRRGFLPPHFRYTMRGEKDLRRPLQEMGLGAWTSSGACFYPLEEIRRQGGALIDRLGDRSVLVMVGPATGIPVAFWTTATTFRRDGVRLLLSTGEQARDGELYDAGGRPVPDARPHQIFTRWYGFAYTIPGCSVYQAGDR
jgi:hypothetical protein